MPRKSKKKPTYNLTNYSPRISVRFSHVLRPFDGRDFINVLNTMEYSIVAGIPPVVGVPDSQQTLGYNGPLAAKGDFLFDLNCERHFFGLMGPDINMILPEFINIFNNLKSMGLIIEKNVLFYELQARFDAQTQGISPIQVIHKKTKQATLLKNVNDLINTKMGIFSIILGTENGSPDEANYCEIKFRPLPSKIDNTLGINIVFRNDDFEIFKESITSIEDTIPLLLNKII